MISLDYIKLYIWTTTKKINIFQRIILYVLDKNLTIKNIIDKIKCMKNIKIQVYLIKLIYFKYNFQCKYNQK